MHYKDNQKFAKVIISESFGIHCALLPKTDIYKKTRTFIRVLFINFMCLWN